jgi:predicted Ser/Thr protein kinase
MPACSSCGGAIPEGSKFCPACGHPAGGEEFTTPMKDFATRTVLTSTPSAPKPSLDGRFLPGALLANRYRIVSLLGKGGMGEVYRADDLSVGQQVALKLLPASLARDPEALHRFRNEVRVARQVSHPNVCRVYDLGESDGGYFLSMEYVDGEDLASLLRRIGRLPVDKALEIARKLCAGLAAAHEKGVLHRDLKPANIMLDGRGQVLLTDFGLAGLATEITGADVRSGTPAYMAPEQLAGKEVSVRSDIYALGLVLYEIWTGKRAFEANTLAELQRKQAETSPTSPSTLVRDLEPAVERVILRCLDPDPSRRPGSALSVAAALPGGDPLAAALASGETPSPQMVAAAGEGAGLSPRTAVLLLLAVIAGVIACSALALRTDAVQLAAPEYSPDVLSQKSRDLIQKLGYNSHPVDDAAGFEWDSALINYAASHDKPSPRWSAVISQRPSLLRFWYRQAESTLLSTEFHNDLLTPGMVQPDDPPPVESGMIYLQLDQQGRLMRFEAVPPQVEKPAPSIPPDWSTLFAAAGLDQTQFQRAEPQWTWLATSDIRLAWTGNWPESGRQLRVEAAALRGKPVAFALIAPWTAASREPEIVGGVQGWYWVVLICLAVLICFGAPWLARRNLVQGRGDRRGAFRLAAWMFLVMLGAWLCRMHFVASAGSIAMFLIAVCTAIFYGFLLWTIYMALEPFVRRYWPQTLVGCSNLLGGNARDPVVGRDLLLGTVLGVSWVLFWRLAGLRSAEPVTAGLDLLSGARSALGLVFTNAPYAVRNCLMFFFLLFLFRVLLRNQWIAAAVWALVFGSLNALINGHLIVSLPTSLLIYGTSAYCVMRWGMLVMATA